MVKEATPIFSLLNHYALTSPEKPALIFNDFESGTETVISYSQLSSLVLRTRSWLQRQGISKGSRLAIVAHNTPEIIIFELAAALINAATVPLDSKRDDLDRMKYKLIQTKSRLLLVKNNSSSKDTITDQLQKDLPKIKFFRWNNFDEFLKILPDNPVTIAPSDLKNKGSTHLILYTSGTTALPKGVILSLKACLLNADGIAKWQKFNENVKFLLVLPLHHINSTIFSLSVLRVGGTLVIIPRYSSSQFWRLIEKFQITHTSIVPTILHDLLAASDQSNTKGPNISSLVNICIGSAPVLPNEVLDSYNKFKVRIIQGYGQTETALRVSGVPVDLSEKDYLSMVKLNTIGLPLRHNQLAIMDENNHPKAENEEGEICVKGDILADGYLNDSQETLRVFKRGWFHSGDLGKFQKINGSDYFFIIGRIKEIIIKGGVNISPSAVENALIKKFPEISEVAVIGIPDTRYGEQIAAVVVPVKNLSLSKRQKLEKQITTPKTPYLPSFEIPVRIFFLESLPKTSTGKIQRVETKNFIFDKIRKRVPEPFFTRQILPFEKEILEKSVLINNLQFPSLQANLDQFQKRAENGLLIGVFETTKGLIGTLSCLRIDENKLHQVNTWNQLTDFGTLASNNQKGDSLVCVAISVKINLSSLPNQLFKSPKNTKLLKLLAPKLINSYVGSKLDHALQFHRQPKGGLSGALVDKIIPDSRPEDKESLGYNVLMRYPNLPPNQKIITSQFASPAVHLVEEAMRYCSNKNISKFYAFSRPSHFRRYLQNLLTSKTKSELTNDKPKSNDSP